jgi:hypothetical protein
MSTPENEDEALGSAHKKVKQAGKDECSLEDFCCLSPTVKKLILMSSDQKIDITSDSYVYFGLDSRINWKKVTKSSFSENTDLSPSSDVWDGVLARDWFIASMHVQKMSLEADKIMNNSTINQLSAIYKLASFGLPIVRIHEAFLATKNALFAFAALCPLIERSLGDLFFSWEESVQPNAKLRRKPPPLIRDLLQTDELKMVLGEDRVFVLQVLIGSPRSLNLRNIIWHGFAATHEIHTGYYWILLVLFLDMSDRGLLPRMETSSVSAAPSILTLEGKPPIVLKSRELKDLSIIPPTSYDFGIGPMSILAQSCNNEFGVLPEREEALKTAIFALLEKSRFLLPGRVQMVSLALEQFANGERDNFAYYMCLVHLLPALEHCLRAVWIKSNSLPSPLLCADSYRYYTIIDMFMDTHLHEEVVSIEALTTVTQTSSGSEILPSSRSDTPSSIGDFSNGTASPVPKASSRPAPDTERNSSPTTDTPAENAAKNDEHPMISLTRRNALVDEIGVNLMIALNDIFLYPFGPRPRDRISHGDVNPVTVTRCAAARCLELFFAIALRYLPSNQDDSHSNTISQLLLPCQNYFENYVTCWHPHALLERQLHETVFSAWRSWKCNILSIPPVDPENAVGEDAIRRREGFHEEMDTVMALLLKISTSRGTHPDPLAKWIHIDLDTIRSTALWDTEEESSGLTLTWFDSLNCESLASATFDSLRKVLLELHSVIEVWNERFESQKVQVESKQASKRLETTFWKQLAVLNLATLFFSACLSFWESRLHRGSLPSKMVRKLATAMMQFKQKVTQNAWDELALAIAQTTAIIADLC